MNVMRSAHSLAYHYRNKPQMHSNIAIEAIIIFGELQESAFIV